MKSRLLSRFYRHSKQSLHSEEEERHQRRIHSHGSHPLGNPLASPTGDHLHGSESRQGQACGMTWTLGCLQSQCPAHGNVGLSWQMLDSIQICSLLPSGKPPGFEPEVRAGSVWLSFSCAGDGRASGGCSSPYASGALAAGGPGPFGGCNQVACRHPQPAHWRQQGAGLSTQ